MLSIHSAFDNAAAPAPSPESSFFFWFAVWFLLLENEQQDRAKKRCERDRLHRKQKLNREQRRRQMAFRP